MLAEWPNKIQSLLNKKYEGLNRPLIMYKIFIVFQKLN